MVCHDHDGPGRDGKLRAMQSVPVMVMVPLACESGCNMGCNSHAAICWPPPRASLSGAVCSSRISSQLRSFFLLPPAEPVDVVTTRYTMDLHMGVLLDAKERRRSEWQRMLESAGFQLKSVTATRSLFSVIEAVPV